MRAHRRRGLQRPPQAQLRVRLLLRRGPQAVRPRPRCRDRRAGRVPPLRHHARHHSPRGHRRRRARHDHPRGGPPDERGRARRPHRRAGTDADRPRHRGRPRRQARRRGREPGGARDVARGAPPHRAPGRRAALRRRPHDDGPPHPPHHRHRRQRLARGHDHERRRGPRPRPRPRGDDRAPGALAGRRGPREHPRRELAPPGTARGPGRAERGAPQRHDRSGRPAQGAALPPRRERPAQRVGRGASGRRRGRRVGLARLRPRRAPRELAQRGPGQRPRLRRPLWRGRGGARPPPTTPSSPRASSRPWTGAATTRRTRA